MLGKAKEVTGKSNFTYIEYARFADDRVILVDGYRRWDWLVERVYRRLLEELAKLDVTINEEKTQHTLRMKARTNLLRNLKEVFRRFTSQPVDRVIELINPKLRGWVKYFRMGHFSRCFQYVKDWVGKKIRRHLMRTRKRKGFGWDRWSRAWLYAHLGLYADYKVRYYRGLESADS